MYKVASRTTLMDISGKYILKEKTMRHPLMSTRDGKIYAVGTTKPFNPIKTYPKELGTFTNKNAKTPQSVQILDKQWKVCPLDKEKHLRPIQESHITNKNNQRFSEEFTTKNGPGNLAGTAKSYRLLAIGRDLNEN
jgi:hypothetical protein